MTALFDPAEHPRLIVGCSPGQSQEFTLCHWGAGIIFYRKQLSEQLRRFTRLIICDCIDGTREAYDDVPCPHFDYQITDVTHRFSLEAPIRNVKVPGCAGPRLRSRKVGETLGCSAGTEVFTESDLCPIKVRAWVLLIPRPVSNYPRYPQPRSARCRGLQFAQSIPLVPELQVGAR
jgi:hypothetical protein